MYMYIYIYINKTWSNPRAIPNYRPLWGEFGSHQVGASRGIITSANWDPIGDGSSLGLPHWWTLRSLWSEK